MRILFLSSWYPYPPSNGSKLRIYNLLRGLAQEHEVTLFALTDRPIERTPPELAALCERVQAFPSTEFRPSSARALLGLFAPTPRSLVSTYDVTFASAVRQEVERVHYDLLVASQWPMTPYALDVPDVPAIFEEVELGVFTTAVETARTPTLRFRRALTLWKLGGYLRRVLRRFDACTMVSEVEVRRLRKLAPKYSRVMLVPNCVDVASYRDVVATPVPDTLIYSGGLSYFANFEAVDWFVRDVLPLVRARRPNVRLIVTGDSGGRSLPSTTGLESTGFVDDVRPWIASSWISLVPLLTGGGTRLKILEAMALRTPIVSTTKGAEGIDVTADRHLLLADTAQGFANAVIRLLEDVTLRRTLTERAYELVASRYDWSVTLPSFLALVRQVAGRTASVDG